MNTETNNNEIERLTSKIDDMSRDELHDLKDEAIKDEDGILTLDELQTLFKESPQLNNNQNKKN